MIISHKHKFIFIHCRKVAGSSVSAFLSSHLAPLDLQVGAWGDSYDLGVLPNLRCFFDLLHPRATIKIFERIVVKPNILLDGRKLVLALNEAQKVKYIKTLGNNPPHPNAVNIQRHNPKAWKEYFKFCFVRNPYQRVVSDYLWRTKIKEVKDVKFLDFLYILDDNFSKHKIKPINHDNWLMYTIDDQIAIDFVGRYEQFNEDIEKVCTYLKIPFSHNMFPNAKKSVQNYDYRSWYGQEEKFLVEKIFAKEIDYFNYHF
jgi:Sulfotransferase family